jgi:hypothetical protein
MWPNTIEDAIISDVGKEKWLSLRQKIRREHDITDVGDLDKNCRFVGLVLAQAWEDKTQLPSLERLCKAILDFAAGRHVRGAVA